MLSDRANDKQGDVQARYGGRLSALQDMGHDHQSYADAVYFIHKI